MLSRVRVLIELVRLSLDSQKVRGLFSLNGEASSTSAVFVGAGGLDDRDLDLRVLVDGADGFFDLSRNCALDAVHSHGQFGTGGQCVSIMMTVPNEWETCDKETVASAE